MKGSIVLTFLDGNKLDFNGYYKGTCKIISCSDKNFKHWKNEKKKVIATNLPSCAPYLIYVFKSPILKADGTIHVSHIVSFFSKPLSELTWETDINYIAHEITEHEDLIKLALHGWSQRTFNPDVPIVREKSFFVRAALISPLLTWFKLKFLLKAPFDELKALDEPYKRLFHRKSRYQENRYIDPSFRNRIPMLMIQELKRVQKLEKHTLFNFPIQFISCMQNRDEVMKETLLTLKDVLISADDGVVAFARDIYDAEDIICLLERMPKNEKPILRGNYVPSIPEYDLNDEQRAAFAFLMKRSVSVLEGGPGTGKTFVATYVLNHFRYSITVGFVGLLIRMVHMRNGNRRELAYTLHHLKHTKNTKLLDQVEVLIIDEASNVSTHLFASFLRLFSKEKSKLKKIIFVGDYDQLRSVKAGDLLYDMRNYFGYFKLERNMRAKAYEVFANAIEMIRLVRPRDIYFDNQSLFKMPYSNNALEFILKRIWATSSRQLSLLDFRIFCLTKKFANELNEKCFELMMKLGILLSGSRQYEIRKGFKIFEGCIISIKKNYNHPFKNSSVQRDIASNGDTLIIESIREERIAGGYTLICLDQDLSYRRTLWVKGGASAYAGNSIDPWHIQRGHCGTTYKNQGREYKHCVFFLETGSVLQHFHRSSAYVAMSRAKESMTLVYYKESDFHDLIQRSDPKRRTCLGLKLSQNKELRNCEVSYDTLEPLERKEMILLDKEVSAF